MLSPHSNLLEQRFICRFLSFFVCDVIYLFIFSVFISSQPLSFPHSIVRWPCRYTNMHSESLSGAYKRDTHPYAAHETHRTHELTLHSWSTMRSQREGDRKQSTSPRGDEGRGEGTWATKTHPFEGRVSAGLNERAPATVVSLVVGWTGLPGATFPRPHHVNWTA